MFRGWISNKKDAVTTGLLTPPLDRLTEARDLEEALKAVTLIFNDDLEGAEKGLSHGDSSFHKLGNGLAQFLRASLGLEAEVIRNAAEMLAEAETASAKDLRRAQKQAGSAQSQIYEPGAEYALCHAMSQLMAAVMAVLRESLSDGLKGFWKLNSAYKTLQRIIESENAYMQKKSNHAVAVVSSSPMRTLTLSDGKVSRSSFSAESPENATEIATTQAVGDDSDDDEFQDAKEVQDEELACHTGKVDSQQDQKLLTKVKSPKAIGALDMEDLESSTDIYIHAGTNVCLGILSLLLSLIPPALSKLLSLVGYKGDRRRGLRMLWASSRFPDAIGAIAALVLLSYYNGIVGNMDIVPLADPTTDLYSDENLDGYPAEQLEKLLQDTQKKFPDSKFWTIEQARMLSAQRRLDESLKILNGDVESPLKQVTALAVFERSLQAMYIHDYALCTTSFMECSKRNNWSHYLYMYTAAAAQVELYRKAKAEGDTDSAERYSIEATRLFLEAKDKTGRRKAFSRQLPFDMFVGHKITKWEGRASTRGVSMIDAIGVSPIEEMIFLWNGHRKQSVEQLNDSLKRLDWSRTSQNEHWHQESADEKALLSFLQATVLRSLGRHSEAIKLIKENILILGKHEFEGSHKESWVLPIAHYEIAVNLWMECAPDSASPQNSRSKVQQANPAGLGQHGGANRERMREAEEWLEKAAKWDSYMLDSRLGMRVRTGLETVKRWRSKWDT